MNAESIVAAETQNPAEELAQTHPEVAEPDTDAPVEEQAPQVDEDPQAKALKSMERRIGRLTAARYQAAAEATQAKAELEQWRQRFPQEEQQQPQDRRQSEVDPVALASEIADIREFTARSNKVAGEGTKRFGDFDKSLAVVIEEAGALVTPVAPGAPYGRPTVLGEAVLDAEDPAALLHYLGANPDTAAELAGLSASKLGRRIARIEVQIAAAPEISSAPKPLQPVTARANPRPVEARLSDEEMVRQIQLARTKR